MDHVPSEFRFLIVIITIIVFVTMPIVFIIVIFPSFTATMSVMVMMSEVMMLMAKRDVIRMEKVAEADSVFMGCMIEIVIPCMYPEQTQQPNS